MNYEQIMEKLRGTKFTMGTMIKLQRSIGKKISVLTVGEKEIEAMDDEQAMQHQLDMMEVLSTLVYIAIGSPAELSPDDVADLIPFDKIEEVSSAIGSIMGQVESVRKN